MSLQSALVAWLKTKTAVTDLIGTGSNARIYPDIAPANTTFPFIVYQRIAVPHEHHFGGAAGLAKCLMQISCWDDNQKEAYDLAEAVRGALDGFKQATFGSAPETITVRSCFLENETDLLESPEDGSDRGGYRVLMDFQFWYVESVPTPQA